MAKILINPKKLKYYKNFKMINLSNLEFLAE
jgi:hypothetical protein